MKKQTLEVKLHGDQLLEASYTEARPDCHNFFLNTSDFAFHKVIIVGGLFAF